MKRSAGDRVTLDFVYDRGGMEAGSIFRAPMVVGYKGQIGRFILAGLLEHLPKANDIHCTDVSNSKQDVVERLEKADYVFLIERVINRDGAVAALRDQACSSSTFPKFDGKQK